MKTALKLLTLIFVFSSAAAFANPVDHPASIKAVSPKYQNLFSFKVDRKFKNGLIEVYYADELVAVTPLVKRKMVINFCDVKSGTYIIKVRKNNRIEEFQFEKK